MKISSIVFQNYKSFLNNTVKFHKWLNVITGPSDSGKSAIVLGAKLVITNRPSGDKYRTHETDETKVKLVHDKTSVERTKTSKLNQYIVYKDSKKISSPKAIKTDIPESVSKTLRLSEINIQAQKEHFFLIDISPGKRAKILNKVAGLEIVNNSIKAISSEINTQNRDIKHYENEKTDLTQYINDTVWIEGADSLLLEIEKLQSKLDINENKLRVIQEIIGDIRRERTRLRTFFTEDQTKRLKSVCDLYKKIDINTDKYKKIFETVKSIQVLTKQQSQINIIGISEAKRLYSDVRKNENRLSRIQSIVSEINTLKTQYTKHSSDLLKTKKNISKMNVCPTCGSLL